MIAVSLARPRVQGPLRFSQLVALSGGVVFASASCFLFHSASVLNLFVSLIALVYLQRRGSALRRLIVLPLVSLSVAAIGSQLLFPQFTTFYWERMRASVEFFFTATEGILSGRLESWRISHSFCWIIPGMRYSELATRLCRIPSLWEGLS